MSYTKPTPAEDAMLEYACAYCGVKAKQWCRTDSGRVYANLHSPRFWLATAAGKLPIR